MRSGTNASIAGLADGGYEVAIQGNETGTGHMWVYGTQTNGDTGGWLKDLTSPSISPVFAAPTGLKVKPYIDSNDTYWPNAAVTFSWNAVPGATEYYAFTWDDTLNVYGVTKETTGTSVTFNHLNYSSSMGFFVAACFPNGLCSASSNEIRTTTPKDPNSPPPVPTTGGISVYYELHAPYANATCGTATFTLDSIIYESAPGYWQQLSENQQPYSASGWCQYNGGFSLVKPGSHTVCAYVGDPNTKSCASKSVVAGSTAQARING
jgi:hypothetical protein